MNACCSLPHRVEANLEDLSMTGTRAYFRHSPTLPVLCLRCPFLSAAQMLRPSKSGPEEKCVYSIPLLCWG